MSLLWLGLWAVGCNWGAAPSASEVAEGVPEGWVWVTSSRGYEVAFPGFPNLVDRPERVTMPDGSTLDLTLSRAELVRPDAGLVVAVTPQPPGGIERAGGPAVVTRALAEHVARSLAGELVDPAPWTGHDGGTMSTIAVPTGRYAQVRVAAGADRLVFAQANSPTFEVVSGFVGSFHPLDTVVPFDVAVGTVANARCPARCGPFTDRTRVGAEIRTVNGFRGMLDHDRFEGAWAEVPPGTDPTVAMEALRDRFVKRVKGHVLEERPDPVGEHPGWRSKVQSGRALSEIRAVVIGGTVIAFEAHSPIGGLPEWVEPFLASISAR